MAKWEGIFKALQISWVQYLMSVNSTIEAIISSIKKKPKNINKITNILELLLNQPHYSSISLEVLQEINSLFTLYTKNISSPTLYSFLTNKIILFGHLLLSMLFQTPKQDFPHYFQTLVNFFSIGEGRKQVIDKMIEMIKEGSFENWDQFNNGQLLTQVCKELKKEPLYNQHIMAFLSSIPHLSNVDFQTNCIEGQKTKQENEKGLKKQFQSLTIHFLVLGGEEDKAEQVRMYRKVGDKMLSKFTNPLMLAEHFLEKFEDHFEEAEVQVQVLSNLFILVGKYGLEMNKFYDKLEMMMKKERHYLKSLFKLSNSKRFIKLLESAMRSSRVPFKTIVSLTKVFISQIFEEQSEFAFWALSFLVNLVKKHRQLQNQLSSLPEVEALKHHSSSRIRSLVGELSKNLNKAEYLDIDQFGKVNCGKLCQQQLVGLEERFAEKEREIEFRI